jgi:nucleotide-binding universal stress UspA family protein
MGSPDWVFRRIELLVIGIRHRTPVGKLLLGSVSQQLLLECPKPVLAVKSEEH